MEQHLNRIFDAETITGVCDALQNSLNALQEIGYLTTLPDFYEDIAAGTPEEVQDWFDKMLAEDPETFPEGALREVYGLFDAARGRLRQLGFHRQND